MTIVPRPIESEKKACPKAAKTDDEVTFEKSGSRKKRTPSMPPGMSIEWIARTIRKRNRRGIITFEARSIPRLTPRTMIA